MRTSTKNNEAKVEAGKKTTGRLVTKVGNLTSDPELRFSEKGTPYCRMRLAVSSPVKPGDWGGETKTAFYDLTAFGSLAENSAESLTKGMRVLVTGRAEVRTWAGDDGAEHKEKGILADALGPDLRWATASVTKTSSNSRASGKSEANQAYDNGDEKDEEEEDF
jgi:single-strand DNA-binding protein